MSCVFQAFRCPTQRSYTQALAFALTSFRLFADMSPEGQELPPQGAAPTALPIVSRDLPLPPAAAIELAGPAQWFIGQPTDEEQLHLELINRSRRDPTAEGKRLRGALMQHFERIGAYADAESQLFALADELPGDAGVAELGRSFYQRLTGLSDEAITAGGLPREEVVTGLQDFHRKTSCEPGRRQ
jgi:hypothetical protein